MLVAGPPLSDEDEALGIAIELTAEPELPLPQGRRGGAAREHGDTFFASCRGARRSGEPGNRDSQAHVSQHTAAVQQALCPVALAKQPKCPTLAFQADATAYPRPAAWPQSCPHQPAERTSRSPAKAQPRKGAAAARKDNHPSMPPFSASTDRE
jgi:hypothetical protein